jgi:hypothetical protein
MAPLRLWILGVALGSFATGLIVGGILPGARAASGALHDDDTQALQLRDRYRLTDSQYRSVRMVLQKKSEDELGIWLSAQQSQLPQELMTRLLHVRDQTNKRIRMVLDDEQRARYDEDCRPPGTAPADSQKR